jgi:broad specificity phosphatase PhoE
MEKTRIFLERHGQSLGNANGIYLGHTDLGLTEEGIEQAKGAAAFLKNEPIAAVYSSDLIRAYQTALPHAELRGLKVSTSKELREMYVGDWEAKFVSDLKKDYLEDFVVRRTHRDFVYPNGESVSDASKRMHSELVRIAKENFGKTVLVVSHSAVIRAFWYNLCGYTEQNMTDRVKFMPNASYCILEYDGEKLIPCEYFCTSHLT